MTATYENLSDPKICAKFFFEGVSAVNSGSGLQFKDGLVFLRAKPANKFWEEVIAEYLILLQKFDESQEEIDE
jgi:hypothetical protein